MDENILSKIIQKKINKIDVLKKTTSLQLLNEKIKENSLFIDFKKKIQRRKRGFS